MSMLEKALAQDKERQAFKNEVIKPIGEEIIELLRSYGLTAKQVHDVIRYVIIELINIAENAKL